MADELLRPPLADRHEAAGAKLAAFAGWSMPLEFTGTLAEHRVVRTAVGVFDVSHLGTVEIDGSGAVATVAAAFTNDATTLADDRSQYTLCATEDGGIVDDLIVYRLATDRLVAIPNAANTAAVVDRLRERAAAVGDADVTDVSRDRAILAVQGPRSLATVAEVLGLRPADVPYLGAEQTTIAGAPGLLCRTGYTGEPGCELVVAADVAAAVWDALVDAEVTPCGLGARDTLRLEMGYPLHGNDIDTTTDPFEARLGWAVKLDRDPFVGQDTLRQRRQGEVARRLLGLRADGRRPLRRGLTVLQEGREVGTVTSGGFSPTLEVGIGLAYLADPIGPGDAVTVDVRGRAEPVEVVRPPFVDRDPKAAGGG